MSDSAKSPETAPAVEDSSVVRPDDAPVGEVSGDTIDVRDSTGAPAAQSKEEESVTDLPKETDATGVTTDAEKPDESTNSKQDDEENTNKDEEKPQADDGDATDMPATPATSSKSKARRKSTGAPEHKGKKLNRKESKAKMSHLDAQPGEYYFIKFKGYPKWPGIIASERMLPDAIKKSRPVTAARPDGTYRDDYGDGGKNVLDRTFPVMFLETNELAWTPNTDLEDIDLDTIGEEAQGKKSKALYAAYQLAAEKHPLAYFENLLEEFEESRKAEEEAKEAAKAAKSSSKKSKKSKQTVVDDEEEIDEDIEMADVEETEKEQKPKASKKRKAATDDDDIATPKRADSVKKPKLKLTHTPKANGAETPKSAKEKKEKAKPKGKKANGAAAEPTASNEPEISPEDKRKNKEKEILFLRHKLQKGLLTRDQRPKEEEMKQMSEYITKLEGYSDLEVSIIRTTKINKVLKAILKLDEIPKEADFKFKDRSTELLGKWNKILESETPALAPTQINGTSNKDDVNDDNKAEDEKKTAEAEPKTNKSADAESPAVETRASDADLPMEDAPMKGNVKPDEEEAKTEAVNDDAKVETTESAEAEAST